MKTKNKLKENQLKLLRHLARFEALDYLSCLRILDAEKKNDRNKLSYAFRPLTKNKYIKKHKNENVTILAKGKALFPEIKPFVILGGGSGGVERINTISRMAMFLSEIGVESFVSPDESEKACFIPSTCWRKIRHGISSTARFAGMLFIRGHRLAVYDIGDGTMEWQLRAERSLFYHNHGEYETRATGMLFICEDDKRIEAAQQIIRTTMWHRKQLINSGISPQDKPIRYAKTPIRLVSQYEHVYLTTPALLNESLYRIEREENYIARKQEEHSKCCEPKDGDYEAWPYRCFVNIATDLLKYVYYFAAAKSLMASRKLFHSELNYALVVPKCDYPILRMYPDVIEMEGMKFYEYKSDKNT